VFSRHARPLFDATAYATPYAAMLMLIAAGCQAMPLHTPRHSPKLIVCQDGSRLSCHALFIHDATITTSPRFSRLSSLILSRAGAHDDADAFFCHYARMHCFSDAERQRLHAAASDEHASAMLKDKICSATLKHYARRCQGLFIHEATPLRSCRHITQRVTLRDSCDDVYSHAAPRAG